MNGYRKGIFPMAENKESKEIFWVKPKERGIIPIGKLHISRSLKRYIAANSIDTTINKCFKEVVNRCADRPTTWINNELLAIYQNLFENGYGFSIEIWVNQKLIGGLFGVKVGSCFCGESMFSSSTNGSKLALVATMALLIYHRFKLFDTQFPTSHLKSMGGCTITQNRYEKILSATINDYRSLSELPKNYSWLDILHLNNHKL
ncbi:MAG: leucyl/phenylalanyl-tRNA--protein transferase [Paracoccaceae bacterium]|nr:leucyl/phenylalanyl-tRNA--protein transferase [Paracoccaceae bacterium]